MNIYFIKNLGMKAIYESTCQPYGVETLCEQQLWER